MTDINELLERAKAATGPDRELDIAFWLMFDPEAADKHSAGKVPLPWLWNVTESIDATLALAKQQVGDNWFSVLLDAMRDFGASGTLGPDHLPRFILVALLQALNSGATNVQ